MKHNNIRVRLEMKAPYCHQALRLADLLRLYEGNRQQQNRLIFLKMSVHLRHHITQDRV